MTTLWNTTRTKQKKKQVLDQIHETIHLLLISSTTPTLAKYLLLMIINSKELNVWSSAQLTGNYKVSSCNIRVVIKGDVIIITTKDTFIILWMIEAQ